MRRLRDRGDVCLRVFGHVDLGDAREELQGLFNAHRQEWRSRGQRSPFEAHEIRLFYERLLGDLLPSGVLHLSVLRTGRVSVSWHFGFECHGVLHYYKPAFSPDYANLSPGKVHLAMLIEEGIRRGWSRIDLGPGMENYKLLWTSDVLEMSQPVWHTHTFRNHLRGWAKQGLARLGVGASGTPLA
jgi:CelD/BcsL family acetyltransferase involved in cellulose biosynthesis